MGFKYDAIFFRAILSSFCYISIELMRTMEGCYKMN